MQAVTICSAGVQLQLQASWVTRVVAHANRETWKIWVRQHARPSREVARARSRERMSRG